MLPAIQVYLDYIYDLYFDIGEKIWIEKKVFLKSISSNMYGTADCIIDGKDDICIIDYKHGKGNAVEVYKNLQLFIYGVAAIQTLKLDRDKKIHLVIVQPRAPHPKGPIRTWSLQTEDLKHYDLIAKAYNEIVIKGNKTLKTGPWCKWCGGAPLCKAQFQDVKSIVKTNSLDPKKLSIGDIKKVLDKADQITNFISACRQYAYQYVTNGNSIKGYKLVQQRKNRKWSNEERVIRLLKDHGSEVYNSPKLISPAQMEKIAGKKFVNKHSTKPKGNSVLVSNDDSRKGIESQKKDFEREDW